MLEKTPAMLQQERALEANNPSGVTPFDTAEIVALAETLRWLVCAPWNRRARIETLSHAIVTRGDFYSQVPTVAEIEETARRPPLRLKAPFRAPTFLRDFLVRLTGYSASFEPPMAPAAPDQFAWQLPGFSYSDAMAYYAMIRMVRPRTVIENGCGTSTLIARQALRENGLGRQICIEPYPSEALATLLGIELCRQRAQLLTLDFFNSNLADGDILFIDSTHTVKPDSDCLHIYLRLLPEIAHDLHVHVHDIDLPLYMDAGTQKAHQLSWMEQSLLAADMIDNPRVRTLYGSVGHLQENPERLAGLMHGRYDAGGGSFWFHQTKRA